MAQHISIRVPWHDDKFCGAVCKNPELNNECLILKGIAQTRDDELEKNLAGCSMHGHEDKLPCLSEGAAFMSKESFEKITVHPYKKKNPTTHGHFLETKITYPPFSFPARPFRWTMLDYDGQYVLSEYHPIKFDLKREPKLGFKTNWVQDADNHKAIFDYFYSEVEPNKSLVLAYAKQVPFIDDHRRILIGIGYVDKIIAAVPHNHNDNGILRSLTWETMIGHTIREDNINGFLLPYNDLMPLIQENSKFDMHKATVFIPDEYFEEFSYATEHVSHDAVIDILLQALKAFEYIKDFIDGNWDHCIEWINSRLSEVWNDRGAYPGLGTLLCAMNFRSGHMIAKRVKVEIENDVNPIAILDRIFKLPDKYLDAEVSRSINSIEIKSWFALSNERKQLFKLLARFAFSLDQARILFNPEQRSAIQINISDLEILNNPYLLFECTRDKQDEVKIPIKKVDLAVFPPIDIRNKFPLEHPSCVEFGTDERRVRALAIDLLEKQSLRGHTIYPINSLVVDINDLPIEPKCNITSDIMNGINEFISEEIHVIEMVNGFKAYQLKRLYEIDEIIRNSIRNRVFSKKRHQVNEDWKALIDNAFGKSTDENELKARLEKVAILSELSQTRLSVLVGGAGTGKTTLLSVLCSSDQIRNGGVLLLAPTGKARVKMSQAMTLRNIKFDAKTVAQFLRTNKRFRTETMQYCLSDIPASNVPDTVIIDESSMLTEEMFGTLIQALKPAIRIIFVGDPNQLPPIGAGRPFVDLVRYLSKEIPKSKFPRVGNSYGELTVTRRQTSNGMMQSRLDMELAKWFISDAEHLDEDVFMKLANTNINDPVVFKRWTNYEELEHELFETLKEILEMNDQKDLQGFDKSLGAAITDKGTYFNLGCAKHADYWQILSPVRNMPFGVININQLIHGAYRESYMELAKRSWNQKIMKPLGPERIIYGDKIISVVNEKRNAFPSNSDSLNYIANGEIGIACGGFGDKVKSYFKVEFSSQSQFSYSYRSNEFGEDSQAPLELAYALTIHKAQGSEFKKVILVLPEPCHLISKELLYTALTRQIDQLIILYNGEPYQLRNYADMTKSEIACRFTNLFEIPNIVKVNDRYYESGLIHRTLKGDLVRSKSEVIIANMLHSKCIEYEYEKELKLGHTTKIPDFTIDNPESGECIYWEHCGMMNDEAYRKRWESKKKLYEEFGIIEGENLIVTYDDENGGLDSPTINQYIKKYFGK